MYGIRGEQELGLQLTPVLLELLADPLLLQFVSCSHIQQFNPVTLGYLCSALLKNTLAGLAREIRVRRKQWSTIIHSEKFSL
jgi:hypothetical protein